MKFKVLFLLLFTYSFVFSQDAPQSQTPVIGITKSVMDEAFIMTKNYRGVKGQPVYISTDEAKAILGIGAGGSISPWKNSSGSNTNSQSDYIFRSGNTSIGVNEDTHTLRVDGDFQFNFSNETGSLGWSDPSQWDRTGVLIQDNGEVNNFPFAGRNTLGIAANNSSIFDRTILGSVIFAGTNPASQDISSSALIFAQANGNWSTGSLPSQLKFQVTENLESLPRNVMTLKANGRLNLDEYVNFSDELPATLLGFDDASKDVTKHTIDRTPQAGDVLKVNNSGDGLEWGEGGVSSSLPETGKTWTNNFVCDNAFGIYFTELVLSDDLTINGDELNSVAGCEAYIRVQTDGTHAVNITGIDYVYGLSDEDVLSAGTYEFYFHSSPDGLSLNVPGAIIETPSDDPNVFDAEVLQASENPIIALSGRYNILFDSTTTPGTFTVNMPDNCLISSISNSSSNNSPKFDDTQNRILFDGNDYFQENNVASQGIRDFDDDYTIVIVYDNNIPNTFQFFYDFNSGGFERVALWNQGSVSETRRLRIQHKVTGDITRDFAATGSSDLDVKHIVIMSYDGTNKTISVYFDGIKVYDDVAFDTGESTTFTQFILGARFNGSVVNSGQELTADIHEFFMYRTKVSDTRATELSNYFNSIHSIY